MKLIELMEKTETLDLFANDTNKIQNMQLHVRQLQNNLIDKYSQYGLRLKLNTDKEDWHDKIIDIEYIYTNLDLKPMEDVYPYSTELTVKGQKKAAQCELVIASVLEQLVKFSNEYKVVLLWEEQPAGVYGISIAKEIERYNSNFQHAILLKYIKKLKFKLAYDTQIPTFFKGNYSGIYAKIPIGFVQSLIKTHGIFYKGKHGRLDYYLNSDILYKKIISKMRSPITLEKIHKQLPWPNTVNVFEAYDIGLSSAIGSPKIVNGDCSYGTNNISTFEGFPKVIKGDLDIRNNHFASLKDIHYHIHEIDGYLLIDMKVTGHLMGLMKIKGLKQILDNKYSNNKSLLNAVEIMNRHLDGKGNFFDCLEELEDAGLEEFAQL